MSGVARSLLISGSYFPPQVGGISTMMEEVCAQLGRDRVAVLTGVPDAHAAESTAGQVRVHRNAELLARDGPLAAIRSAAALWQAILNESPTLLQFATIDDAARAYWLQRTLRLKYVVYAHGNEILSAVRSAWERPRKVLSRASRIIAVSRYTESILRNIGVEAERLRIVHPGCDLDRFKPTPIAEDARLRLTTGRPHRHVVLTVGNLVERKGHDTVIRALALLPRSCQSVLYLIAGAGPYRDTLERLADSLGVADRVVFLGHVAAADLPLLYSMADVFVMASRERNEQCDVEGFGIVFIEAAACGTPAIGGRSGGIEDAVVDGVTGLLVDPLDARAVASAIELMLTDRALAHRLGEAARSRATANFGWVHFGKAVAAILDDVAAG